MAFSSPRAPGTLGGTRALAPMRNRVGAPAGGHNWPAMLVKQPSMSVAYVSNERKITLAAGALLLSSLSLGGCATSTAGSSLMDARDEAAPAPPHTSVYPLLGELPPQRAK